MPFAASTCRVSKMLAPSGDHAGALSFVEEDPSVIVIC
jgi:hypothetical protein